MGVGRKGFGAERRTGAVRRENVAVKRPSALAILLFAAIAAFPPSACADDPASRHARPEELMHRRFILVSANGAPFRVKGHAPEISFDGDFRVSGAVCNRFTGRGKMDAGVLTAGGMISTRMFCPDAALNELENDLMRMLEGGAEIVFNGGGLILRAGGATLEFASGD
jgi:heat shock protein HslJ